LERRLCFNQSAQCFNCHLFGHHIQKCTKQSTCRWCSNHTPLGITPAPLPPVHQEASYAHILSPCVSTAVVLMKHTLPPVPNT
jgi:hypothetical protein